MDKQLKTERRIRDNERLAVLTHLYLGMLNNGAEAITRTELASLMRKQAEIVSKHLDSLT